MLTLKPAKSMKGRYDLPPSPDLFVLAVISALAARKDISIAPFTNTPTIQSWINSLKGCSHFESTSDVWNITPIANDPADFIVISAETIPYRDLIIFTLLGMGKTVAFTSISMKRIESWKKKAKKYGIIVETGVHNENPGLVLVDPPEQITVNSITDEEDIAMLLGLACGLRISCTFTVSNPYNSPFRTIAPLFGFELTIRSLAEKETDPIARRIKMMQKKPGATTPLLYLLTADFTGKINSLTERIPITLPGDEILSALFLSARCLIQKGSFVLENMPLETWCAPVLSFIRKMGTKVTVQETGRTSFGSTGILTMQKIELIGRKLDCRPASTYFPYVPSLVILASFAKGQSVFRGIEDLRNDDPDGIDLIESCIRKLGARHGEMPDGIVVEGSKDFDGFDFSEPYYPSLAGAFAIAGLRSMGTTTINDDLLVQRWPDFESAIMSSFEFRA